jgi:endonuclease-8
MEGPSIYLAAEQLRPFVGRRIGKVSGNSRIGIARLRRKRIDDIFGWGKQLVFQFDGFALRVHFLLWGTFAATVEGESVTGDYRRSGPPRLELALPNGQITIWSASLRWIDSSDAKAHYDASADVLSDAWDPKAAIAKIRAEPDAVVADVLLDQNIFAGVGNIIKNEVLFRTRTDPFARVGNLSTRRLNAIVAEARTFSFRFLELRRVFALRKHLEIYGKSLCATCGGKVNRRIHGKRQRRSFFCATCQRARPPATPSRVSRSRTLSALQE